MSQIIINKDNISRFNKRLQKSLNKHLNKDIKLSQASQIFSEALGVSSEHELKKILTSSSESFIPVSFEEMKIFMEQSSKKFIDLFNIKIQDLLIKSKAEFFYYSFQSDWDGAFVSTQSLGFNKKIDPFNDDDIFSKVVDPSNYGFIDFTIDKELIVSPNNYQLEIMDILSHQDNFNNAKAVVVFFEDNVHEIMEHFELDKQYVIYRDKIVYQVNN